MPDKVRPNHYNNLKIKPIDVIEEWELGFSLGNCVKYISRCGRKEGETELDDLKKALWYLQREVDRREKSVANF